MPASSKVAAVYMSYAVSIENRSPRSFISRRWWVRIRAWRADVEGAGPAPVPYGAGCSLIRPG